MAWDLFADIIDQTKHSGSPSHVINISLAHCFSSSICSTVVWNHMTDFLGKQIIKAVRTAGLENNVLFVLAAGNDAIPAYLAGEDQRAFLGPFSDTTVVPLTNGLVVENFKYVHASATDITAGIGCRASDSCYGGSIGGFGDLIWGYDNVSGHSTVGGGTSFAAPQIAAVAHFVWTMADPTLTAPQIVDRIIASGTYPKAEANCGTGGGLVVDAYAAALTADREIKIGRAPVRETILDVANDQDQDIPDGKFDHHDIKRFLKAFADAATEASGNSGKYTANYSRFDLNGDGYTGGSAPTYATRFKLEEPFPASYTRPNPLSYGTVTQNIEGVPVSFNENSLTDLEILAYYAYSPLFDSTPESQFERTMLFLPYADKLHLALDRIGITWKPTFQAPSGWTAAPAIEIFSLSAPTPTYSGSNFLLEEGNPLFSYQVPPTSTFYAANDTTGVPYLLYPNRIPASSFFAYDALRRVWINATTRHWQITGSSILEREYQSRFALGAPTATGRSKTATIGSVPGDNNFNVAKTMTGDYFDVTLKFVAAP
jgi:hypothetical protein